MNLRPFVCSVFAAAFLQPMTAMGVPHIFNSDGCPVLLVQETEFSTMPYHNNDGEVGTTLVVGKALGGIGADIAPGSVVLLMIQGKSEEVGKTGQGRRLFVAQVNESLARPLHPSKAVYYVDGYDFSCFSASWLLKMKPEELKPEWRQLQQQVDEILNPANPTAEELHKLPAPDSPEQQLFAACAKMQANANPVSGLPYHKINPEVHALIAAGVDVNARCNTRGMTPLMQAALHNDSVTCTQLLRSGANPDLRDADGMTALNYALIGSNVPTRQLDAFRAIFEWSPRTDLRCTPPQGAAYKGATLLHHAVLANSRGEIWMLLRRGADAAAVDDAGRTALELARKLKRTDLIPLLEKALDK